MVSQSQTSSNTSDEWSRALRVAGEVKLAARGLQLEPKFGWLPHIISESADQLRAAVLWAAAQSVPGAPSVEAGRPLIIAADSARSNAALASYFLSFLSHKGLIQESVAGDLAAHLSEVERRMDALSRRMREDLALDPYAPS
jgi:hypothetical protein